MRLFIVRHGQTPWNVEDRHQGWQDVPLSEFGQAQAERIGERLKEQPFDYIFSSPIKRCYDTAAAIVAAQGRSTDDIAIQEGLKEARLSAEAEGKLTKDIFKSWTKEQRRLFRDDYTFKLPDGESVQEVAARVHNALIEIAALSEEAPPQHDEDDDDAEMGGRDKVAEGAEGQGVPQAKTEMPKPKTALIVSHKLNCQLLVLFALDAMDAVVRRQGNIDRLDIGNCALSIVDVNLKGKEPFYRVLSVGDMAHLAGLQPPKKEDAPA